MSELSPKFQEEQNQKEDGLLDSLSVPFVLFDQEYSSEWPQIDITLALLKEYYSRQTGDSINLAVHKQIVKAAAVGNSPKEIQITFQKSKYQVEAALFQGLWSIKQTLQQRGIFEDFHSRITFQCGKERAEGFWSSKTAKRSIPDQSDELLIRNFIKARHLLNTDNDLHELHRKHRHIAVLLGHLVEGRSLESIATAYRLTNSIDTESVLYKGIRRFFGDDAEKIPWKHIYLPSVAEYIAFSQFQDGKFVDEASDNDSSKNIHHFFCVIAAQVIRKSSTDIVASFPEDSRPPDIAIRLSDLKTCLRLLYLLSEKTNVIPENTELSHYFDSLPSLPSLFIDFAAPYWTEQMDQHIDNWEREFGPMQWKKTVIQTKFTRFRQLILSISLRRVVHDDVNWHEVFMRDTSDVHYLQTLRRKIDDIPFALPQTEPVLDLPTYEEPFIDADIEALYEDAIHDNLHDLYSEMDIDNPVGVYLKQIAKIPLLTADEEVSLAKQIELGKVAKKLFDGREAHRQLQAEQIEDETMMRLLGEKIEEAKEVWNTYPMLQNMTDLQPIIDQGVRAREDFIQANTRLSVSIAKRYMNRGIPFLDLIQEGNLGVIHAIDKYEYTRGHKLSTYATWWIRQRILRSFGETGRTIRRPAHVEDALRRLRKSRDRLQQELGRLPIPEELQTDLDWSNAKLTDLLEVEKQYVDSLHRPVGENDDAEFGDFISDENEDNNPEFAAFTHLSYEELYTAIEALPSRYGQVMKMRFGLEDTEPHTLEEIGNTLGITRERVRQIEKEARRKLLELLNKSKYHS